MEIQNTEIDLSKDHEMNSRSNVVQKLVNVLRAVQKKWSKFPSEGEEDYERRITRTQRRVYRMGKKKHWWSSFDYSKAELDPSYDSEVLKPFMQSIRRRNNKTSLVLDLGAGKGEASVYMEARGMETVRVDISNSGLIGQENAVQASGWRLPFSDGSFDGIHSKDMVSHIPPRLRDRLFSELYRVMKPGGIALICSAKEYKTARLSKQYPTSKKGLQRLAKEQGFTVENTKEWRPAPKSKDWYFLRRRKRFVLQLRK